jgi:Protein of unknown function (DUF2809)
MIKQRFYYLGSTIAMMLIGYASRYFSVPNTILYDYVGDALWAAMIYLGFRFLFPQKALIFSLLCAIGFSYGIELSQFYHAEWIDYLRSTRLGSLVLGFDFLWSDIFMYSLGIIVVYQLDKSCNKGLCKK